MWVRGHLKLFKPVPSERFGAVSYSLSIRRRPPAINKPRRLLPAMRVTNLPRSRGTVLITPGYRSVDNRRWSEILRFCIFGAKGAIQIRYYYLFIIIRIAVSAYPTCSRRPVRGFPSEYWHNIWYGRTRMVHDCEKSLKICLLVSTEYTNVTVGRTLRDGIGCPYA